jgi:Flp pilus assembly CpaF family ATPase
MSDGLNDLPLWSEPVEPGPRPFLVPDLPPVRPTAPPPTPARSPGAPTTESALDWELVRALRSRAATELSVMDLAADQQTAAVAIVADLVAAHTASEMAAGRPAPSPAQATALARAVLDALFGLGRLQPHVDNPQVENIEVYGHDHVLLEMADGTLVDADPVADTDAELIETIAFAAARADGSPRPFSEAHPTLHLRLTDGARLAASYWTTPRPVVVIRLHRLVDVTLTDLVMRDMLDPVMASFLAASVRAGRSIVVSGPQGGGKTTLVRALCAELDPDERIGTIETERELHLHETGRHRRIVAWESRPGSGERGPDGRMAGEITLAELVEGSLRFNLARLIVGEVRGREIISMFQAMQSGAGSMSTTHAPDARAAIERLVTCAMEANAPAEFAYRQVADHINLIVQIAMRTHTGPSGQRTRTRFVSEVLAVEPGENGRPATTSIWRADPVSGRAVPGVLPGHLADELARFGFDPATFDGGLR